MALREYVAEDGRAWMVWDVAPRFSTTRSGRDRRETAAVVKYERRNHPERRGATPPPEWINGWLCFQTVQEKRRLCPVPEKWEESSPDELERLRQRAAIIRSI